MIVELSTSRTDVEIAERVEEVRSYDLFSALTFSYTNNNDPERRLLELVNAEAIIITSKDGSTYVGYVEDWDDSRVFVNLK